MAQQIIVVFLLIAMVFWLFDLFSLNNLMLAWIAVAMLVAMLGIMLTVNGIKQGLKKAKVSRRLNKVLTLAACFILPTVLISAIIYVGISVNRSTLRDNAPFDDSLIPLSVTDFQDVDEDKYIEQNRNNETFLVGQRVVNMFGDWNVEGFHELPDLEYTVTTVKFPFLYEWCKDQEFRDKDEYNNDIPEGHRSIYKEVDADPWGAETAYRLYHEEGWWQDAYMLCYAERIIEIRFDWEPSIEDMAIVNQKLNQ